MKEELTFTLPPAPFSSRIGFFGGSFDPPHLGHLMLGLSFLALESLDELWIVPCDDHALKDSVATFSHRLAMCDLSFGRLQNAKVIDIEHHLKPPNYTINTIKAISDLRPDLKLLLGLGSDLVSGFASWHQAPALAQMVELVIFERVNYPCKVLPELLNNARVHRAYALPDINSTALRNYLRSNANNERCPYMDPKIWHYIQEHGLYR